MYTLFPCKTLLSFDMTLNVPGVRCLVVAVNCVTRAAAVTQRSGGGGYQMSTRSSTGRYMASPGWTLNAAWNSVKLDRGPLHRHSFGPCGSRVTSCRARSFFTEKQQQQRQPINNRQLCTTAERQACEYSYRFHATIATRPQRNVDAESTH